MKLDVGDPKWTMRRRVMLGIFGYYGALVPFAFLWPVEKIKAIADLLGPINVAIVPIMLSYLGAVEVSDYLKSTKTKTTTETPAQAAPGKPKVVEEKTVISSQAAPIVVDEIRPPKGELG